MTEWLNALSSGIVFGFCKMSKSFYTYFSKIPFNKFLRVLVFISNLGQQQEADYRASTHEQTKDRDRMQIK